MLGSFWTHSAFVYEHMGGRAVATTHNKRVGIGKSIFEYFLSMYNHHVLMHRLATKPTDGK